jgi:hypothetical protein
MARVIQPRGRAVVVDLLKHDREDFRRQLGQKWAGFEVEKIGEMMALAGLGGVNVTSLPPDENAKGPALFLASGVKS